MKNLDIHRFGQVLKLDFALGRKNLMWAALAMLLAYLFIFWLANEMSSEISYSVDAYRVNMICREASQLSLVAMLVFLLVSTSQLFSADHKKQRCIYTLMLPATNLEKFLSRWVYLLVYSLVGGLLMFLVADALHMVWLVLSGHEVCSATPLFFNNLPHTGDTSYMNQHWYFVARNYCIFLVIHATFLLGSVLFKRFHFVVTGIVLVFVFVALASTYNWLHSTSGEFREFSEEAFKWYSIGTTVFYLAVTALFTWLAYRLFCRWQVVTHKFVNL